MDPIKELADLLKKANLTIDFDSGRDITKPCTFCAKPAAPYHKLYQIGTFLDGRPLTRPVCAACTPIVKAMGAPCE